MRWSWKIETPQLAILAAMFAYTAIAWSSAPDKIPVHWNLAGQVDRYGGKAEGLLLLPVGAVLLYIVLRFAPALDPYRANYESFAGEYNVLRSSLLAFFGVLHVAMLRLPTAIPSIVGLLIGALLVVLGFIMPRFRMNWFAGIRTPWTLSSELSWTKTHELGGRLFVAAGLAVAASSLFGTQLMFIVTSVAVFVAVIVPVVYSYMTWRNDPNRMVST